MDQLLAFARYLSWADLQATLFEEEMNREHDSASAEAVKTHEWRWFGLMSYWYSSLNAVIEAWDTLELHDPILDRLLAAPNMRHLLQRYRNAVLHFQSTWMTPKFRELLHEGERHVFWIQALHQEFVRFLADYFSGLLVTAEHEAEFRTMVEGFLHWYPYRYHRTFDAAQRIAARARAILATHPNDDSEARRGLERAVEEGDKLMAQSPQSRFEELRIEILRKAGIE